MTGAPSDTKPASVNTTPKQVDSSFKGYMTDPASQHPYMYCGGNPISYSDPSGYDFLSFDGKHLIWYNDHGKILRIYYAYSGTYNKDAEVYQKGRIPEGKYTINFSDIQHIANIEQDGPGEQYPPASWGTWRVRIWQGIWKEKNYSWFNKGRGHFFLHGGEELGIAGCIEIAHYKKTQVELEDFMMRLNAYGKTIPLTVKYPFIQEMESKRSRTKSELVTLKNSSHTLIFIWLIAT